MKKIGEILVEQGKLSERDVERALLAQNEMGEKFGQVLIKLGLVSELDFANALAEQQEIPLVLSSDYPEEAIQIEKISRDFLLSNMVVPISVNNEEFCFSAAVPQDPFISKALRIFNPFCNPILIKLFI